VWFCEKFLDSRYHTEDQLIQSLATGSAFEDRRTAAEHMAVAMDIVDAGDAGPEFVLAEPWRRPGGLGARIRAQPLVAGHTCSCVRGVFEWVVCAVELAGFDGDKFGVDREQILHGRNKLVF